jgi:hypothetical protein
MNIGPVLSQNVTGLKENAQYKFIIFATNGANVPGTRSEPWIADLGAGKSKLNFSYIIAI